MGRIIIYSEARMKHLHLSFKEVLKVQAFIIESAQRIMCKNMRSKRQKSNDIYITMYH